MKQLIIQLNALGLRELELIKISKIHDLKKLPEKIGAFRTELKATFVKLTTKNPAAMGQDIPLNATENYLAALPINENYHQAMLIKLQHLIEIFEYLKNSNADLAVELTATITHLYSLYTCIETAIYHPKHIVVMHLDAECRKYQLHLKDIIVTEAKQIAEEDHCQLEINFSIDNVAAHTVLYPDQETTFPSRNLHIALEKYQVIINLRRTLALKHPAMANINLNNFRRELSSKEAQETLCTHRTVLASVASSSVVAFMRNPPWKSQGEVVQQHLHDILDETKKLDGKPGMAQVAIRK